MLDGIEIPQFGTLAAFQGDAPRTVLCLGSRDHRENGKSNACIREACVQLNTHRNDPRLAGPKSTA
jgi:hypothetical protein